MSEGKYCFNDGTENDSDLLRKPNLCLVCQKGFSSE